MEWELMNKTEAKAITDNWNSIPQEESVHFENVLADWKNEVLSSLRNEEYKRIHSEVEDAFQVVKKSIPIDSNGRITGGYEYKFDYLFGLRLFFILEKHGFGVRQASLDKVWIFLCMKLFPDIVSFRFPPSIAISYEYINGKKMQSKTPTFKIADEKRFWSHHRRIYLKSLWWYVYLSLQKGNSSDDSYSMTETEKVIQDNSTDSIVQTVERAGNNGYRVEVMRTIMRFYQKYGNKNNPKLLRRVMVLNTAKSLAVEPALCSGGLSGYVESLFEACK